MIIGEFNRRSVMLSAVTRVDRDAKFEEATVHTLDGEIVTYSGSDFDGALHSTVQASFPAEGAVQLVTEHDEKMKPCGVWKRAILGFYLDATGELRAVTMDGNFNDVTILFADGHVEAFEARWESLDEYTRELVAKGEEQRLVTA